MTAPPISALAYSPDAATGAAPAVLAVRQLRLTDFRNYRQLRLDAAPSPIVLVGANGAGKTNLLEALSFLAPGRGLRRARLDEVARRSRAGEPDAASWAVAATLDTPEGRLAIGTGLEPAKSEGSLPRRVVRIDGRPAPSQTALGLHVAAVWLTPQLDRLFLDGPGERRRFLDRLVTALHPEHAGDVAAYENALRQRARLLAEGSRDPHWLAALEDSMARHGVALAAARRRHRPPPRRRGAAGHRPLPARRAGHGGRDRRLARHHAGARRRGAPARASSPPAALRDAEAGTTSCGPHRSDLAVRHLDSTCRQPRARPASRRRSWCRSCWPMRAWWRCRAAGAPLLLLDEIAAHLDAERRAALFDELVALGAQGWMTGTDAELFAPLAGRAQVLRVADGSIAAA